MTIQRRTSGYLLKIRLPSTGDRINTMVAEGFGVAFDHAARLIGAGATRVDIYDRAVLPDIPFWTDEQILADLLKAEARSPH
jgi:hypothetical protein